MDKIIIYYAVRIIFVSLYIGSIIKEIINIKKYDKNTILPGLFLCLSMWGSNVPVIINLFIDIFLIVWLSVMNFLKKKKVKTGLFSHYIIPPIIIILSISLCLFYLYKNNESYAIYYIAQILCILLLWSLFSCILYALTYTKFIFFKIKSKKSFKEVFKAHKTTMIFPFIAFALLPLILI